MSISLAPYYFTVTSGGESVLFGDVSHNFLADLREYLDENLALRKFESKQKVVNLSSAAIDEKSELLYGIIESGDYGYTAKLYDLEHERLAYTREVNHAELIPYYYLIHAPKNKPVGIILLQRFKQYGISTIFNSVLKRTVRYLYGNLSLKVKPIISKALINELLKGQVVSIKVSKFGVPEDLSKSLLERIGEGLVQEVTVKDEKGTGLQVKKEFRTIDPRVLEDLLQNFFDVKIFVEYGNNLRTISLVNLSRFRNWYRLEDLTVDTDGHPNFDELHHRALEILDKLKLELYDSEKVIR